MGSGDFIAGGNPASRKRKTVTVKNPTEGAGASARRSEPSPGKAVSGCGAMSQQRTDSGAASTPQKFLHLVGCRDSKVRPPGRR